MATDTGRQREKNPVAENYNWEQRVDKELELNENKTDDSNETENKQNQEEEKVDDNLKSEEPKEK